LLFIQEGGAARARDLLGQAVDRSAESGPDVDITGLKAEAQRIIEQELRPPAQTFPRTPPDAAAEAAHGLPAGAEPTPPSALDQAFGGPPPPTGPPRPVSDMIDAVAQAQAEAGQETLRHPAMGVLSRILNAADTVPFKDAHLFKKELDEDLMRLKSFLETGKRARDSAVRTPSPHAANEVSSAVAERERLDGGQPLH